MVIRCFEQRRRMYEHNENCDKGLGSMLQNTMMELENTLERFNHRLEEAEERIQSRHRRSSRTHPIRVAQRGKKKKKVQMICGTYGEKINQLTFTLLYRFPKKREKWVEILLE